jgi:FkbH-like protein
VVKNASALPWLLAAPSDFRSQVAALRVAESVDIDLARRLAGFALDASQLNKLGAVTKRVSASSAGSGNLRPLRLAIAATHTVSFVADALPATGLRHGLLIETFVVPYGQAFQQVFDPASELAQWQPDFILLSLDPKALGLAHAALGEDRALIAVDQAIDQISALKRAVHENLAAVPIVQTLAPAQTALFGNFDARLPGTLAWLVNAFNQRLVDHALGDGDLLLDTSALACTVGMDAWSDTMRWHDAKLPFSLDMIPLYADHICRLLAAARGLSRKCLVLDLDNTLWSGVIGDDGVEGISLGQGSASGEAHLAIQQYAMELKERGIVLAVCSKNEMAAALLPFQQHDEMVLQEDHISVFLANWADKATNLRAIAKTLNIGTDALVFLDDNPAERERVRQELPEVAVPEVGQEPSDYVRLMSLAGYFEAVSFGEEDRQRAEMYKANARRTAVLETVGNLETYLQSLGMVCSIRPFDQLGRSRIAQLINKSNQFNLTTRRYTEKDVAAIEQDPGKFSLQVRLVDRFGDNGMISVVVFDRRADEWLCDTWLMSCRVLGRRVEEAVLAHVAKSAQDAGATRLIGEYIPSAKNAIVEKHFEKLGFTFAESDVDGRTRWILELADYMAPSLPMTIKAEALAPSRASGDFQSGAAPALQDTQTG